METTNGWILAGSGGFSPGKGEGLNLCKLRGGPERKKERLLKSVF